MRLKGRTPYNSVVILAAFRPERRRKRYTSTVPFGCRSTVRGKALRHPGLWSPWYGFIADTSTVQVISLSALCVLIYV